MRNESNDHVSLKESISALMDGEHTEMDLHRVLKATEHNEEARAVWSRYHMVRSSLNNDSTINQVDLSSSIMSAIAAEPEMNDGKSSADQAMPSHNTVARPRWFGQFAVAASCAFAVLLGAQFFDAGLGVEPLDAPSQASVEQYPASSLPSSSANTQLLTAPVFQQPSAPLARTVSSNSGLALQGGYYSPVSDEDINVMSEQALKEKIEQLMKVQAGTESAISAKSESAQ